MYKLIVEVNVLQTAAVRYLLTNRIIICYTIRTSKITEPDSGQAPHWLTTLTVREPVFQCDMVVSPSRIEIKGIHFFTRKTKE